MAYIDDWDSIESMVKKYFETPGGKKKIQEATDQIMLGKVQLVFGEESDGGVDTPPEEIAKLFEQELLLVMYSNLSKNVTSALSNPIHSKPFKLSNGDYAINVYWKEGSLSRDSLNPTKELYDLAELYDVGVDHEMSRVWGRWHGKHTGNKTIIEGTDFLTKAADSFQMKWGNILGLTGVHVTRTYQSPDSND